MQSLSDSVRGARVLHIVFVLTLPVYVTIGELVGKLADVDMSVIFPALLVVGVLQGTGAFFLRGRLIGPAADALRLRPDDAAEITRWMTANFASFALCEAIGLFGFVVRILGGTLEQAVPFYVLSFFLLVSLYPRSPVD
jgi:F0F1-type ATP synthase membrane subunit c/vacuolar-type H+-ATPase subunit K